MAENAELDPKLVENQQQAAPTVHFEMNINEVNVILAALQELPHRVADPILRKLMEQAQAQLVQPE
jgi:hypothetical protein